MANIDALMDGFAARLAVVEGALGLQGGSAAPAGGAAAPAAGSAEVAPQVAAFDEFSAPTLKAFAEACATIGGPDAAACNELVVNAWSAQRAFLVMASQCKKPAKPEDMMALMKQCGVVDACQAAGKAIKRGDFELHYKTVSESLGCLNWLMVAPKPKEIIEAQLGSADYSANKIRLQYKRNTDAFKPEQHAFCDNLKKLFSDLLPFIKAHHVAGVEWNPRGGDASAFAPAAAAPAPAAAAPVAAKPAPAAAAGGGGGPGDLKAALEAKKDNAAAGLKTVTKDMQTWREDYKKPTDAPPLPKPKVAPRAVVVRTKGDKQVAFKQQGMRWCVEAQTKDDGVVEVACQDVKHSIAIYGCFQATINITGKCKGVTVDTCEQVKVLLDGALSSVELVNCKRMQVQIRGKSPTVAIDKTDGCLVYLSAEGLDTGFTTAKSSEMNVSFPDPASPDGELIERPIPEQFTHKVVLGGATGAHISAEVSELYSH